MINCLIPIKDHSERILGKNYCDFLGVPLYKVIVNTLLECDQIKKIYIDTDSEKITYGLKKYSERVEILPRDINLCGDYVSVNKIIENDLNRIDGEYFLQTHCTNPLLKRETIHKAINFFMNNLNNYDSLFSITKFNSRFYNYNFEPLNHNPKELYRTQDLEPIYEENSNIYIFSRRSFQINGTRIGEKPYLFEMDKLEAIDIDNKSDLILAKLIKKGKILE